MHSKNNIEQTELRNNEQIALVVLFSHLSFLSNQIFQSHMKHGCHSEHSYEESIFVDQKIFG